jgi:hypothetical protein
MRLVEVGTDETRKAAHDVDWISGGGHRYSAGEQASHMARGNGARYWRRDFWRALGCSVTGTEAVRDLRRRASTGCRELSEPLASGAPVPRAHPIRAGHRVSGVVRQQPEPKLRTNDAIDGRNWLPTPQRALISVTRPGAPAVQARAGRSEGGSPAEAAELGGMAPVLRPRHRAEHRPHTLGQRPQHRHKLVRRAGAAMVRLKSNAHCRPASIRFGMQSRRIARSLKIG